MGAPRAVVTTSRREGRDTYESEQQVGSLEELYRACRDAPPSAVVRVVLAGDDGDVTLQFGAFIRDGAGG
jgi:hypothetical protein